MTLDMRELLNRHFLFRNLDGEVIDRITALGVRRRLEPNQVLFLKGDPGDALFGVLSGRIRICTSDAQGKEIMLNIMDPGEVFGEIALLDGRPRTAEASAMTKTELFQVNRRDFVELMRTEHQLTIHLLEMVCDRVRSTSELVEDSAFLKLPARLAKRLLSLAKYQDEISPDDAPRGIKISQSELGQLLGSSRESINKHLQQWRKKNWISLSRGNVTIEQPDELQQLIYEDGE